MCFNFRSFYELEESIAVEVDNVLTFYYTLITMKSFFFILSSLLRRKLVQKVVAEENFGNCLICNKSFSHMKIYKLFSLRLKEVYFPPMLMRALDHSRYNYRFYMLHIVGLKKVLLISPCLL